MHHNGEDTSRRIARQVMRDGSAVVASFSRQLSAFGGEAVELRPEPVASKV